VALGLAGFMSLVCVGQETEAKPSSGMVGVQEAALRDSLQGRWTSQIGRITVVMTLDPNSRVQIGGHEPYEGLYEVRQGQLVPRPREYCLSQPIEIPKDRVIVFYGSGRVRSIRAVKKRIKWVRESKVQSPNSRV